MIGGLSLWPGSVDEIRMLGRIWSLED